MKKFIKNLRDILIAGFIFLLPLLVVLVIITKVFQFFKTFNTRIAGLFGIKSMVGISAASIAGVFGMLLFCLLCGLLVRLSFFDHISHWIDEKLVKILPSYGKYRNMALGKIEKKEEVLPYEAAAWIKDGDKDKPGFIMETMKDGKIVVFIPTAGNVKEGEVLLLDASGVKKCPGIDMKSFNAAINKMGVGMSKFNET